MTTENLMEQAQDIIENPADQTVQIGTQANVTNTSGEPVESAEEGTVKKDRYYDEAYALGWRPKEEFNGDPEDYRSPREFVERGIMLKKIHDANREIRSMKYTVKNTENLLRKQAEAVRNQTLAELNSQKRNAIENGDVKQVEYIEQEMQKHATPIHASDEEEKKQIAAEWVKKNSSWFNKKTFENTQMVEEATRYDAWLHENNNDLDPAEALEQVTQHIKTHERFAKYFENPARTSPPRVESATPTAIAPKKSYNAGAITPNIKKIADDFVRKGVFKSHDAYYAELAKIGELK